MHFEATPLDGAYVITPEPHSDERGLFARVFCKDSWAGNGAPFQVAQINQSVNTEAGTLRGMHFQRAPGLESKIVRCVVGRVFDAIVDLRAGSETFGQSFCVELHEESLNMILVPAGFAHGFQTLTPGAVLVYLHSELYQPGCEGGVFFDDPDLQIDWPLPPVNVSERDQSLPLLSQVEPIEI